MGTAACLTLLCHHPFCMQLCRLKAKISLCAHGSALLRNSQSNQPPVQGLALLNDIVLIKQLL